MLKTFKTYISRLLLAVILVLVQPTHASASFVSWIENTFEDLLDFLFSSCLEVPDFNSFTTGTAIMDLSQSGRWISIGTSVRGDKMLKIQWNTYGVKSKPRKYMILYRIDPRFPRPQVFIVQLNYATGKYESDFHRFQNGKLTQYQANPEMDFATTRISKYNDYFNFGVGRNTISVDPGDVINITLANMSDLLSLGSEFRTDLNPNPGDLASVYTTTGIQDNAIFYSDSQTWCNYISQDTTRFPNAICVDDPGSGVPLFGGPQNSYNRYVGIMDFVTQGNILALQTCPPNASGPSTNPPCIYDKGRGMRIMSGGKQLKDTYTSFIHSDLTGKDFFYYKADGSGDLDFLTSIPINNMFLNLSQDMTTWRANYGPTVASVASYLVTDDMYSSGLSKYLHLGRYIMMVDIGSVDQNGSLTQQNDIALEYKVLPSGSAAPSNTTPGTAVTSQEFSTNAPISGNLWLRVINPHTEVGGRINVSYAYYTGSTFLSDILYNSVALPIMDMMRDTAALFYSGIAADPQWQLTVRILLSLYIIIYGLSFLAGKIQVTVIDVINRVIKLAVVFAMFSDSSWRFFNENVFNLFLGGMGYLASNVMGVTSSVGNLFGFVDIIFDKYTNPKVWQILGVELLQIQNGMTYLALLMIEAIFSYLSAVVEVVICYIMAFLSMCILISLAPIFLVCMLFERTRSMFDNWMSLLLNYMIQPTVLLIFFLLIDKLMVNQFSEAVMQACWNWLITINIDLDLSSLGINFRLRFDLPFLPGIPFYTAALVMMEMTCPFVSTGGELSTVAGAVLMFKIYAQLSNGLIEYVTNLVASLTNVAPARKAGAAQNASNPTKAIADQLKAPARAVIGKASAATKDFGQQVYSGYKNPQRSGAEGSTKSGEGASGARGGLKPNADAKEEK